ncbi:MAG: hypothetical protein F4Y03_02585 [Alphaproteobacteria bacterium]|nr:hypothetical protein [Alphaproteobacteria bacterium]
MTGWAFTLLVWLAGAPAPVQDASIYTKERADCEVFVKDARQRYEIGKPHPVYGRTVRGIHAVCLQLEKPAEEQRT